MREAMRRCFAVTDTKTPSLRFASALSLRFTYRNVICHDFSLKYGLCEYSPENIRQYSPTA
jgi:hypothetical protein